jgi:hypothetical protein
MIPARLPFMPEEQTLFTEVEGIELERPAFTTTWVAGAWPEFADNT